MTAVAPRERPVRPRHRFTPERLQALAAAVDAKPTVASRANGRFGTAAAYLPGERLAGLRVRDDHVEVHVVLAWPHGVEDVTDDVLDAARAAGWSTGEVRVVVDDIQLPEETQ